jgi:hypothetical protein
MSDEDFLDHYRRPLTINKITVQFFMGERSDITVAATLREEQHDSTVRWARVETNIFDEPTVTADLAQLRDDVRAILDRRFAVAIDEPASDDRLDLVGSLEEDIVESMRLLSAGDMNGTASMLAMMAEQLAEWRAAR